MRLMRRVLMDTHAFLWLIFDDPQLSGNAARVLADAKVEKLLSIASVWEIVVKSQIGKLSLGMKIEDFCREYVTGRQLELIPIELPHLLAYGDLPLHHRDPFDRLIISQALSHDLPVVSKDDSFCSYPIEVIWS